MGFCLCHCCFCISKTRQLTTWADRSLHLLPLSKELHELGIGKSGGAEWLTPRPQVRELEARFVLGSEVVVASCRWRRREI